MPKPHNRLTKRRRNGKGRRVCNRTRYISKTTMSKYKKSKHSRQTKTRKSKRPIRRAQNGGGFISSIMEEGALNLFRSIPASVGHFADTINGQFSPASSFVYPTQQPNVIPINNINSSQFRLLPLNDIYDSATMNSIRAE